MPSRWRITTDNLALAGLVLGQAAVPAVLLEVGRLHVAAEAGPIDLHRLANAAELVALDLVTEDRGGGEVGLQGLLVEGEQGAAG